MQVPLVVIALALAGWLSGQTQAGAAGATTPAGESASQLDEPLNGAATTSTGGEGVGEPNDDTAAGLDDACVRCYDKVKVAQDLVDIYESLLRKQNKLIQRKKAAAEAAARPASSSVRSRTLNTNTGPTSGAGNEPIVVSRLRVARSPAAAVEQYRPAPAGKEPKYAGALNKKDLELERLKREQQRQKDATCKALLDVRDCLDLLTRECIGNLQFHTYEVFSDQWHGKLRCPYPNHPGLKPLPGLLPRSIASGEPKLPVPRPISSDDEVRQRLQKILPDRQFQRPPLLGVMLVKPAAAAARGAGESNSPPPPVNQQQQQQLKAPAYQSLMRDYSHFGASSAPAASLISGGAATQLRHQQPDDQQLNMVNVGKLLLVPCGFALMVALAALLSLRHRPEHLEAPAAHLAGKW